MPATYDSRRRSGRRSPPGRRRLTATTKRRSGIPTRTGRIGTRSTWWTSSPGQPSRTTDGART